MTIGRRLYQGFGAILGIMVVLLVFNILTVVRQYTAHSAANAATEEVRAIESVRYQVMQNRLSLGSYLLSGDTRDEDKTNKGINDFQQMVKESEAKATGASLRATLSEVDDNENNWAENFAKPMMTKRHQVDSGNSTVSDLQIYYLQHDPYSWTNKSASLLDQATRAVEQDQTDTNDSSTSATTWNAAVTITGTLLAALVGGFIAFRTANSITEPTWISRSISGATTR
jgi:CHASE3 domain sensor protein